MTVIFSKRDDTMFLQGIWHGLENIVVVEVESQNDYERVENALRAETELVLLCGHGTPSGLLYPDKSGFIINDLNVNLIKDKTIIGIWCYAADFAKYHCLNGFFSSMFISDYFEALGNGFVADSDTINAKNRLFANIYLCRKIEK